MEKKLEKRINNILELFCKERKGATQGGGRAVADGRLCLCAFRNERVDRENLMRAERKGRIEWAEGERTWCHDVGARLGYNRGGETVSQTGIGPHCHGLTILSTHCHTLSAPSTPP